MKETKRNGTIKTLKIDGQDFSARQDDTILEVARENNIFIPTLCDLKGLSTVGACRLCLVEVKGSPRLFPACVTRVEEGMEVTSQSERSQHIPSARKVSAGGSVLLRLPGKEDLSTDI